MQNAHTALRASRLLIAVAAAVVLFAALSGRAEAHIDISGDWNIALDGTISVRCTVAIVQTGTELFAAANCGIGSGDFRGSIDAASGSFDLSGLIVFSVVLTGTASEEGNSISGTWTTVPPGYSGTFTGNRASETPSLSPPAGPGLDIVVEADDCPQLSPPAQLSPPDQLSPPAPLSPPSGLSPPSDVLFVCAPATGTGPDRADPMAGDIAGLAGLTALLVVGGLVLTGAAWYARRRA